jgi:hypothetical protein
LLSLALAAFSPASEATQIANAEAALTGGPPIEKNVLALAGSRARREAKSLVLVLGAAKSVRFSDDKCAPEEQPCPAYTLAAFLPSQGVFVVRKDEYEDYDYVLVETANGKQHTIEGPPHYSPDGTHFVTCRIDEMNGGGTTIWRVVAARRYVKEWKDDHMSVCGRWRDKDTFQLGVYNGVPMGKLHASMVVRNGSGWQLRK